MAEELGVKNPGLKVKTEPTYCSTEGQPKAVLLHLLVPAQLLFHY